MKNANSLLFEILVGVAIGLILVILLAEDTDDLQNFALGKETTSILNQPGEQLLNIGDFHADTIDRVINEWKGRGSKEVILILGNSQTHAINQFSSKDSTYNARLFEYFQNDYDVITQSFPNANLQELYIAYAFWKSVLPIKMVVLPVFMDDMREDGIREAAFKHIVCDISFTLPQNNSFNQKLNQEIQGFSCEEEDANNPNLSAVDNTTQQNVEYYLNNKLNSIFPTWENRPSIRGKIITNAYLFRNFTLNINAQTKRKMIPHIYENNLLALKSILELSAEDSILSIIYIPPIRYDVSIPYNAKEYSQLLKQVEELTYEYSNIASFQNLEKIVPAYLWGKKESTKLFGEAELDFMHFQNEGHKILYQSLKNIIEKRIDDI